MQMSTRKLEPTLSPEPSAYVPHMSRTSPDYTTLESPRTQPLELCNERAFEEHLRTHSPKTHTNTTQTATNTHEQKKTRTHPLEHRTHEHTEHNKHEHTRTHLDFSLLRMQPPPPSDKKRVDKKRVLDLHEIKKIDTHTKIRN